MDVTNVHTEPTAIAGRTTSGKRRTFRVRVTPAGVALDIGKSTGSMDFIRLDPDAAERFGAELLSAAAVAKGGAE